MNNSYLSGATLLLAGALFSTSGHATTLLLDLGFNPNIDSPVNSPFHQELGEAAEAFVVWNTIGADANPVGILSGDLLAADSGSVAATWALVTGFAPGGVVTWNETPGTISSSNLGSVAMYGTGVYAGNSVGKDAVFFGVASAMDNPGVVGVVVTGLPAGDYTVFVVADNTYSTNNTQAQMATAAALSGPDVLTADVLRSDSAEILNYGIPGSRSADWNDPHTETWVDTVDYQALSITLEEGESLLVSARGLLEETGENRGFLNAIMITPAFDSPEEPWDGWVDTGWIGTLWVSGDWAWSQNFGSWIYLPQEYITTDGGWAYVFR